MGAFPTVAPMKRSTNIAAWAFGLSIAVIVAVVKLFVLAPVPSREPPKSEAFVRNAISEEQKGPDWLDVAAKCSSEIACQAVIQFSSEPVAPDIAEQDTTRVARAVLRGLQAAGHDPVKESASVFVSAVTKTTGDTGAHQLHLYGITSYSAATDSLGFSKP